MPMLSKDGAASSIQARMRGRAERKANAAKAKAEEKAEKAAAAAESKSEQETAATKMQATIRGRAARKAEAAKAQQAAGAAGGSDQAPVPKKKSFFAKADGGVHVVDGSAETPRRRSTLTAVREKVGGAKDAMKDAKKSAKTAVAGKVAEKTDAFLQKNVMKVLGNAGEMVKEGAKAPGMPEFMTKYIDEAHEFLWDDVERELCEGIMLKYGVADNEYKKTALSFWTDKYPKIWPTGEPYPWLWRWVRARFLHATQPADTTIYQNLREAGPLLLTIISLYPPTSVPLFLVTLIFINKTDEFQLVNYILKFKGAQFLSAGIMPAAQTGMKLFFSCFKNVAVHGYGLDHLPPGMCVTDAPGPSKWHLLIMEPMRIVLLYYATYLLASQGGYGGIEEIKALEEARTDAADGCLDGVVDKKVLKERNKEARGEGKSSSAAQDGRATSPPLREWENPVEITFEAKNLAINQARERHCVQRAHGFMLPIFLKYDACVIAFLTLCFGLALVSVDEPTWMLWTCAYYFRLLYSILSFPFLIFLAPIVGPSLHHAKPTAYDKQGMLVPKLTTAQIKLMIRKAEKDAELREGGGPKSKALIGKMAGEAKGLGGKAVGLAKNGAQTLKRQTSINISTAVHHSPTAQRLPPPVPGSRTDMV